MCVHLSKRDHHTIKTLASTKQGFPYSLDFFGGGCGGEERGERGERERVEGCVRISPPVDLFYFICILSMLFLFSLFSLLILLKHARPPGIDMN